MEQTDLDTLEEDSVLKQDCSRTIERFISNVESILKADEISPRLKRYIWSFFSALSNEWVVIQRYAQYIPETILNHKDFQNAIKEVFEEKCSILNIRELLVNIIEYPNIFKNIDFIYESKKIQDVIKDYFRIMDNNEQNIIFLERFVKQ